MAARGNVRKAVGKPASSRPLVLGAGRKLFDSPPAAVTVDDPVPAQSVWVNYLREKVRRPTKSWALLLKPASSNRFRAGLAALKVLTETGYEGVYLSLCRPFGILQQEFADNGIDSSRIRVADAVSMQSGGAQVLDRRLVYVNSPTDLMGISIAIDSLIPDLEGDRRFVMVDSLEPVLQQNSVEGTARFAHFLVENMKAYGVSCAFIVDGSGKDGQELSALLSPALDETIDLP